MKTRVHSSPGDFLARAASFLAATSLENNVIAGIAHRAVEQPLRYPDGVWCATVEADDRVVGAALQTPPWPLVVTSLDPGGVASLLASLAGSSVTGVVGPEPAVAEVVRRLGAVDPEVRRQRLYSIRELPAPPTVPGRFRPMEESDRDVGIAWIEAFDVEVGERRTPEDRERTLDFGIAAGQFYLWEDGERVAMANCIPTPPEGARIGAVYTPPGKRRRGYAGAIVSALTRKVLEAGTPWCCLYTDLSNPTSNSIYQKIGYRRVMDGVNVKFDRPIVVR